ncbi:MAG: hypothetical protein ABSC37_07485 [Xanthobacteraceae bacterium]
MQKIAGAGAGAGRAAAIVEFVAAGHRISLRQRLIGVDLASDRRTAERLGIAGLDRNGLLERIGAKPHAG